MTTAQGREAWPSHLVHGQKTAGSNPAPATNLPSPCRGNSFVAVVVVGSNPMLGSNFPGGGVYLFSTPDPQNPLQPSPGGTLTNAIYSRTRRGVRPPIAHGPRPADRVRAH